MDFPFKWSLHEKVRKNNGEFDPGSEWKLATWLRHANRAGFDLSQGRSMRVANGCVTRKQFAL